MDFNIFEQLFTQITAGPGGLIILCLAFLNLGLEKWPNFPNWLLIPLQMALGATAMVIIGSPGAVDYHCTQPRVVLGMLGFCMGGFAGIVQKGLLNWIINKLNPAKPEEPKS